MSNSAKKTPRLRVSARDFLIAALMMTGALTADADIKLPAIFGDHMVLQQGVPLTVWGWADAGERVTVSFAGRSVNTTADADGKWRVELPSADADAQPRTLTVSGKNTITLQDVLVGEVWLASGQSNMELGIQTADGGMAAIEQANDPQLRMFFIPWATSLTVKDDFGKGRNALDGKWVVCTPENMKANWAWHGFSAIGYFFAKDLRAARQAPVGMIAAYKGGTPAESWTSLGGLAKDAALAEYIAAQKKVADNFADNEKKFEQQNAEFREAMKQWNADVEEAKKSGATPPRRPNAPTPPDGGFGTPGNLFNAMIAPLTPFAMRGVIWYQGESNGDNFEEAVLYRTLFPRMIEDWREAWGRKDLAFLFVELANFIASKRDPEGGIWCWVRDAQRAALSLPMTGMASAIDIGHPTDIHPLDKLDVGKRLALAARQVAYGEKITASGPLYDTLTVEGNKVRLKFKSTGGGLCIGVPPWAPDGKIPSPSAELAGFLIAAEDEKFVPAKAVIEGNTVVVSADGVASPTAVRYNWADNPRGNLYNREGLPAPAFRTDTWTPRK